MQWLMENSETIMAAIGSLFVFARCIVALTPTDRDNQMLDVAQNWYERALGKVALILGLDTRQGINKK